MLSFDIEARLTVYPEFSDWKTGNWKGVRRWPAVHSRWFMCGMRIVDMVPIKVEINGRDYHQSRSQRLLLKEWKGCTTQKLPVTNARLVLQV